MPVGSPVTARLSGVEAAVARTPEGLPHSVLERGVSHVARLASGRSPGGVHLRFHCVQAGEFTFLDGCVLDAEAACDEAPAGPKRPAEKNPFEFDEVEAPGSGPASEPKVSLCRPSDAAVKTANRQRDASSYAAPLPVPKAVTRPCESRAVVVAPPHSSRPTSLAPQPRVAQSEKEQTSAPKPKRLRFSLGGESVGLTTGSEDAAQPVRRSRPPSRVRQRRSGPPGLPKRAEARTLALERSLGRAGAFTERDAVRLSGKR